MAANSTASIPEDPVGRLPFALGSLALSAVLTAIGSFRGNNDDEWRSWLIVSAIAAVATVVVFWVVVPRIHNLHRGALILAIIGAVTIVVFWLGLPVVIAGGAALLGLEARRRTPGSNLGTAALVIAALTVVAAVVLAFLG